MENLFDLDLDLPAPKRKGVSTAAPAARLAAVDTIDALAAFMVEGLKATPPRPAVDAAGLVHFKGIGAQGYGAVAFPVTEALAFARALVALSKGEAVTPPPVTLAAMIDGDRKLTMVENLLCAEPYVGASGSVIALKVAGSNYKGSSKPKATLVSLEPRAMRTLAFYIASAAKKADPAQAEAYVSILTECLAEGKVLRAKMEALAEE